jgi:hypothetical protein
MSTKPGYVPPPSTGHELGIMFGFIGLMLVVLVSYAVLFGMQNKRALAREEERVRTIRQNFASQGVNLPTAAPADREKAVK